MICPSSNNEVSPQCQMNLIQTTTWAASRSPLPAHPAALEVGQVPHELDVDLVDLRHGPNVSLQHANGVPGHLEEVVFIGIKCSQRTSSEPVVDLRLHAPLTSSAKQGADGEVSENGDFVLIIHIDPQFPLVLRVLQIFILQR